MKKITMSYEKTKIRKGVFETNSSSVHVIGIAKDLISNLDIPSHIHFGLGEFGWEEAEYTDVHNKADYINTLAYNRYIISDDDPSDYYEWQNSVKALLLANGVSEVTFYDIKKIDTYDEWYYVDHSFDFPEEQLKRMSTDGDFLMNYLFNPKSVLITGNDNSENCPREKDVPEYCNEVIWKGN